MAGSTALIPGIPRALANPAGREPLPPPAPQPPSPSLDLSPASWIWYPEEERPRADRFFRRKLTVEPKPASARLRITCDNGYVAFLDGEEVGRGNRWETVQEYDVTGRLRSGANVLAVQARNDGDAAGLIAELTLVGSGGDVRRVGTDAAWRAARSEEPGWRDVAFDDGRWVNAQPLSGFEGSLWAQHPQGPPQLEAPPRTGDRAGSLAMRWHGDPDILPFDTRPGVARPTGWYRFTSPPGLRGMMVTARGKLQAWADGKELEVARTRARDDGAIEYTVRAARPAPGLAKVALRIEQARGSYGGAALPEPIRLDCGPGLMALGDWSQVDGLSCYSGGAWYRKTFDLTAEQTSGALFLDLGSLVSSAEVHVNGRLAGVKVAPPWRLDITSFVRPGSNRLEVLIYSTLGNHYLTIPTRYRGSTVAGLLGPVTVTAAARPGS